MPIRGSVGTEVVLVDADHPARTRERCGHVVAACGGRRGDRVAVLRLIAEAEAAGRVRADHAVFLDSLVVERPYAVRLLHAPDDRSIRGDDRVARHGDCGEAHVTARTGVVHGTLVVAVHAVKHVVAGSDVVKRGHEREHLAIGGFGGIRGRRRFGGGGRVRHSGHDGLLSRDVGRGGVGVGAVCRSPRAARPAGLAGDVVHFEARRRLSVRTARDHYLSAAFRLEGGSLSLEIHRGESGHVVEGTARKGLTARADRDGGKRSIVIEGV